LLSVIKNCDPGEKKRATFVCHSGLGNTLSSALVRNVSIALQFGNVEITSRKALAPGGYATKLGAVLKQLSMLGDRIQIVGDDLYLINPDFIRLGIDQRATNVVLIKLNQIGTVTEMVKTIETCRKAGWNYVISHRSGETAMGSGQIKIGSLSHSCLAKYDRPLEIECELGSMATYESPFKNFQHTGEPVEGA
jgi:Enolase, C-terminal TIM barrel domain